MATHHLTKKPGSSAPVATPAKADPLDHVYLLVSDIEATVLGCDIGFTVARDRKRPKTGRIFLQCCYEATDSNTGEVKEWHGRKWYLSDHMTDDEVVKTCFAALKATVEHEVMESFLVGGVKVFNPHVDHRALREISGIEVFRKQPAPL